MKCNGGPRSQSGGRALKKENQEVERLRHGYDDLDTRVKEKIKRMRYESLEEKDT